MSSSRSTTRSPCCVGKVETRTSTGCSATRSDIRPSCGKRFSAISNFDITLIRDTSAPCNSRRGDSISRNTPSTLKRTTDSSSNASRCISDAFSRIAWVSSALIKRMIGASSSASSRSVVCGISWASRSRSSPSSMSSINWVARLPPWS